MGRSTADDHEPGEVGWRAEGGYMAYPPCHAMIMVDTSVITFVYIKQARKKWNGKGCHACLFTPLLETMPNLAERAGQGGRE